MKKFFSRIFEVGIEYIVMAFIVVAYGVVCLVEKIFKTIAKWENIKHDDEIF